MELLTNTLSQLFLLNFFKNKTFAFCLYIKRLANSTFLKTGVSKDTPFSVFHICSQLHLVCWMETKLQELKSCRRIKSRWFCICCLHYTTIYNSSGLKLSCCAIQLVFTFCRMRLQYSIPKIYWTKQLTSIVSGIFRLCCRINTTRLFLQFIFWVRSYF